MAGVRAEEPGAVGTGVDVPGGGERNGRAGLQQRVAGQIPEAAPARSG
jgi:hypothetical protein